MNKRHLLFAAALTVCMGSQAQMTDVTSTYIASAGFEECAAIEQNDKGEAELIVAYNIDGGTDYSDQGWHLDATKTNANAGVVSYGSKVKYSKWINGVDGPSASPKGSTTGNALCFTGNAAILYKQTDAVTLPAGSYRLTVNVYAYDGATSNPQPTIKLNNFTGFVADDGTEYLTQKQTFNCNAWDTDVVELLLTEPVTGRFQLSYGSQYYVMIDDIVLEYEQKVITSTLEDALNRANALVEALGSAPADLQDAINAAEAFIANPTSQDDVPVQVEALFDAMGEALMAAGKTVDITAVYLDNPSFETGQLAPWTGTAIVTQPTEPTIYIDGRNMADFAYNEREFNLMQAVGHLPMGLYYIDAKLCGKAKLMLAGTGIDCQGGTTNNGLWLRVNSAVINSGGGTLNMGAEANNSFYIDDFHLFYGDDEDALLAVALTKARTEAQAILDESRYASITGEERTAVENAISAEGGDVQAAIVAINAALNTFANARDTYDALAKVIADAKSYTIENYPYGSKTLLQQIQTLCATPATSVSDAAAKTTQLTQLCFDYYVSNAYAEGIEGRIDYTEQIKGANATGNSVSTAWTVSNVTIRTDKNAFENPKTGESDKNVYGVTQDYYRASGSQTAYMQQKVKGLPAGQYVFAVTMMASSGSALEVKVDGQKIGEVVGLGTYGGGKYGGGWIDGVMAFEKTDDADLVLRLESNFDANYKEWYADNMRLYRIDVEQPNTDEYGIVGDFSSWEDDLMLTQSSEDANVYTLTIADKEIRQVETFEYKVRANGAWGGYELPMAGAGNLSWTPDMPGFYTLNFTFNLNENTCTLDATRTDDCTWRVFYLNVESWPQVYAYTFTANGESVDEQAGAWPGTLMDALDRSDEMPDDQIVYELSLKSAWMPAFIIFNNGEGGPYNQTFDLTFEDGKQYNDGAQEQKPATAVENIEHSTLNIDHAAIYDLQGRRIDAQTLTKKGVYIVDGKKVVKK